MRHDAPPPIAEETMLDLREGLAAGASEEELIEKMRSGGLHQGESIKAFKMLYGGTLLEAKLRIHNSQTWSDSRDSVEALHETAVRAVSEFEDKAPRNRGPRSAFEHHETA